MDIIDIGMANTQIAGCGIGWDRMATHDMYEQCVDERLMPTPFPRHHYD